MRWHKLGAQATVCLRLHAHPSQTEAAFCDHLHLERRAACGAIWDYCYRPAKVDLGSGITWQLDFHVWTREWVPAEAGRKHKRIGTPVIERR